MKYNPKQKELWRSKMVQRATYKKSTFITDTDRLADIVKNGGQVEMKAQEVREINGEHVQVIECRIFFIATQF